MAENDAQVEPVATEQTDNTAAEPKWTDEKVDAYVKARIDKQNAKHSAELAALQARFDELKSSSDSQLEELNAMRSDKQRSDWARQVSDETGIPADVIRGTTLEEMQSHAAAIKSAIPIHPSANEGSGVPQGKPSANAIFGEFMNEVFNNK